MRNHIFPTFGELNVKDVELKRLQKFFNAKADELAIDTVHKIKQLLNNFFEYAVDEDIVVKNPVKKVMLRKNTGSDKKGRAMRPEIRESVLNGVMGNPILKPITFTFMFTGIRPQELIALRWENLDLSGRVLSVKEAVNRTVNFDHTGAVESRGAKVGKTKTLSSVRRIKLPKALVSVLQEWSDYCKTNNIVSVYVFPCTETGNIRTYSGLRSLLERFKKSHGFQDEGISWYTF